MSSDPLTVNRRYRSPCKNTAVSKSPRRSGKGKKRFWEGGRQSGSYGQDPGKRHNRRLDLARGNLVESRCGAVVRIRDEETAAVKVTSTKPEPRCMFCQKSRVDVAKLIESPTNTRISVRNVRFSKNRQSSRHRHSRSSSTGWSVRFVRSA